MFVIHLIQLNDCVDTLNILSILRNAGLDSIKSLLVGDVESKVLIWFQSSLENNKY